MLENLFVLSVLVISGGYITRRLGRMHRAHQRRESACGSCSSASCTPAPKTAHGETPLPLKQ
ncbi:MAG: hypothetical protein CVV27_08285 [Candidatus Melainabacteria bacterium HGW-Melainabacteria-1]|nr:MAG: hypothetical protein CVV27_08285 [Candidatus Melainabacteria bacterium HGW-Melainabacteria-1]